MLIVTRSKAIRVSAPSKAAAGCLGLHAAAPTPAVLLLWCSHRNRGIVVRRERDLKAAPRQNSVYLHAKPVQTFRSSPSSGRAAAPIAESNSKAQGAADVEAGIRLCSLSPRHDGGTVLHAPPGLKMCCVSSNRHTGCLGHYSGARARALAPVLRPDHSMMYGACFSNTTSSKKKKLSAVMKNQYFPQFPP